MSSAPAGPLLLAIDNGSQSTKVSVIDAAGRVLASGRRPLAPYDTSVPGTAVHPGDDLWDSIARTCRETLGRFAADGGDLGELVAVGLCTIRFCRALLTADGELAEPVQSWMDERVSRPYQPRPGVRWVTTSSGYIGARLTGNRVDTAANYQGEWPFDLVTGTWSDDPADYRRTGVAREQLFDLVPPGGRVGAVTAAAAAATGIPAGLPVHATANDKAVEALGCGLTDDGTVLLSLGTYIAAMSTGTSPEGVPGAYWVNAGARPRTYLHESTGIRRGMWTVSWFRDLLTGGPGAAPGGSCPEDALDAEAARLAPGSNGLLTLLDWLAPGDAAWRRGAILGFDGSQGRAHVWRSILEGIALTMAAHTAVMEEAQGRRLPAVLVSGGGSRSDLVVQIVADVFDRPVRRTAVTDAAGLGAAITAAVGAGVHPSWDAAVAAMVTPGAEFLPDPVAVRAYQQVAKVYADLPTHTDRLFRAMADGLAGLPRAGSRPGPPHGTAPPSTAPPSTAPPSTAPPSTAPQSPSAHPTPAPRGSAAAPTERSAT